MEELSAQSIPFSFALGAIVPVIIGMLPTWIDPARRSPLSQQQILAMWQPDPLWVSLIQQLLVAVLWRTTTDSKRSYCWVRSSYLLAAASSALGHLYVMAMIFRSVGTNLDFTRMYVPFLWAGPSQTPDILVRGPWLFLQYDFIIISLSSLSWAYLLVRRFLSGGTLSALSLGLILGSGALTVGPGATVSLALFWREGELYRVRGIDTHVQSPKHRVGVL